MGGPEITEIPDKNLKGDDKAPKMLSKAIFVLFWTLFSVSLAIKISSDGGYTDIVIKIKDQVPEDKCPQILQNLKVKLNFLSKPKNETDKRDLKVTIYLLSRIKRSFPREIFCC